MLRFRSRVGLWLIRIAIAVPLVLAIGWPIFEWGNCTLGLTHAGTCSYFPYWVGEFALIAIIAAYVIGLYISPFVVLVGVIFEGVARYR